MSNILHNLFALPLLVCTTGGCSPGDIGERQKAIRDAIMAVSYCDKVHVVEHHIANGSDSVAAELVSCEVTDSLINGEAEFLNKELLDKVPSYDDIDRFTFVFVVRGIRYSLNYANGKRVNTL